MSSIKTRSRKRVNSKYESTKKKKKTGSIKNWNSNSGGFGSQKSTDISSKSE